MSSEGRALWRGWLAACFAGMALAFSAAASGETAPTPAPALLPTEAYAHVPQVTKLVLSPDGQRIAALLHIEDKSYLATRRVEDPDFKPILETDNKRFRISWAGWVGNERLVFSTNYPSRRGYTESIETRLLSISWTGAGEVVNLVRQSPFESHRWPAQYQDQVIDWLAGDGRHVLLQMAADGGTLPGVYKVDVFTGQRQLVHAPRRGVYSWLTDATHRVRLGVRYDDQYREILVCDPDGQNWRTLWRFKALTDDAVYPMGFGKSPDQLYVKANHEGRLAVFTVDLSSPELKRSLKLSHPTLDVAGGLLRDKAAGDVVGVSMGTADDESRGEIWDDKLRLLARAIDKALPKRDNRLFDFSEDGSSYLLYSTGNGIPPQYYLGKRSTGELELVAEPYPMLTADGSSGKREVTMSARDGLLLHAYLTLPKEQMAVPVSKPLPMVLIPYGIAVSGLNFDRRAEFLASRGYAVLQVNYRGAGGYGQSFFEAGLQRWGLEMQDDLADAARWAVENKVADAGRICIVGSGLYGGYAALMGVVKTPDLYRCAVSFAGASNLLDYMAYRANFVGGMANMEQRLGKAWSDRERLKATSPALQVDRITAPVLLVHGAEDRGVPYAQSEDMAKALRKAGKAHRLVTLENGYSIQNSQSLAWYKALEVFLAENIGSVASAQTAAKQASAASAP